jgi:addiction module RelE/StbE family toxin
MKLRWTRIALQDLRHLHEYISEDNPLAASRMVTRIQDATQRLKKHPHMGRPGRVQGTREIVIVGSPYIVVYILGDSEIQIVAVIHSSMRWPDTFRSEDT